APAYVIVPADHPLAGQGSVELAELSTEPLVLPPGGQVQGFEQFSELTSKAGGRLLDGGTWDEYPTGGAAG
ncbi:LysR substrate-binding domain-containing protein, partial [Streptomyces sp. NPDC004227]